MADDWFWAAARDAPALKKFVIANGQPDLWRRVRAEIDQDEDVAWMPVHPTNANVELSDVLDMMLRVVPTYGVDHNRFVFEAAQMPVFARYLRNASADLCNYVFNPIGDFVVHQEPYSEDAMRRLGRVVNTTLGTDDDWF